MCWNFLISLSWNSQISTGMPVESVVPYSTSLLKKNCMIDRVDREVFIFSCALEFRSLQVCILISNIQSNIYFDNFDPHPILILFSLPCDSSGVGGSQERAGRFSRHDCGGSGLAKQERTGRGPAQEGVGRRGEESRGSDPGSQTQVRAAGRADQRTARPGQEGWNVCSYMHLMIS